MKKQPLPRRDILLLLGGGLWLGACGGSDGPAPAGSDTPPTEATGEIGDGGGDTLFEGERMYIPPAVKENVRLRDAKEDGWRTETLHELAKPVLHELLHSILEGHSDDHPLATLLADGFACAPLRPSDLEQVYDDGALRVQRGAVDDAELFGAEDFPRLSADLLAPQGRSGSEHELTERAKIIDIQLTGEATFSSSATIQIYGQGPAGATQQNMTWQIDWAVVGDDETVRASGIRVESYEEIHSPRPLFGEQTGYVFGDFPGFEREYLRGAGEYQHRIDLLIGNAFWGFQGIAIGDVDADGLEDLYVSQQAGLPNRLFLHQSDGTVVDHTRKSRTGYLENTASALILDMDNDGAQDLVVALGPLVAVTHNDGMAVFGNPVPLRGESPASIYSLSAADPDLDGDLDVYATRHSNRGLLYEIPTPYFDANNGSANSLFINDGDRKYHDATNEVGLGDNNTKFSYASLWEDFDDDGDPDLYVANDYGRNNLFRNTEGKFTDVAFEVGAQDISAGMGASSADFDLDGDMDLYISNMFSSAGRRIIDQKGFHHADNAEVKGHFERHARGNTLLANNGDGTFEDVTVAAGVAPGGWAWGAKFIDMNNDGFEDLYSPCGFVTGSDPGDL
jgi:hypothetical protein